MQCSGAGHSLSVSTKPAGCESCFSGSDVNGDSPLRSGEDVSYKGASNGISAARPLTGITGVSEESPSAGAAGANMAWGATVDIGGSGLPATEPMGSSNATSSVGPIGAAWLFPATTGNPVRPIRQPPRKTVALNDASVANR
jgi:hypothetical protein